MLSIIELAKKCGVSKSTAERAINNKPGVSDKTKKKVLEAAKEYGYRPNPFVREILTDKSKIIGAATPLMNSFNMALMEAIKKEVHKEGYQLFVTSCTGKDELYNSLEEFAARRFAAGIIVPDVGMTEICDKKIQGLKVISLNHKCTGNNVFSIVADETDVVERGVSLLQKNGHSRISYLTFPYNMWKNTTQMKAFENIMNKTNSPFEIIRSVPETSDLSKSLWTDKLGSEVDADHLMKMILRFKPTAIMTKSFTQAVAVTKILSENKIKVPNDISVLSLGGNKELRLYFKNITAFDYPFAEIAKQVASCIIDKKNSFIKPNYSFIDGNTISSLSGNAEPLLGSLPLGTLSSSSASEILRSKSEELKRVCQNNFLRRVK